MSYSTNIVRLRAVAKTLGAWKDKVVFVGGATVSLYASRPKAVSIRVTDDVDVVVELISRQDFYALQEYLIRSGYRHDMNAPIISRFLLQGLIVDFMPVDPTILGFSNRWYADGVKHSVTYKMTNNEVIRIFTSPYFIASKFEAFRNRGNNDIYASHDLEDIVFVLDNRDTIGDELQNAPADVMQYLREEFTRLLSNKRFEEALIGHVEQSDQTTRKNRIMTMLQKFVAS